MIEAMHSTFSGVRFAASGILASISDCTRLSCREEPLTMIGLNLDAKSVVVALAGFSIAVGLALPAHGQSKGPARKANPRKSSSARGAQQTKAVDRDASAADEVKLRDGKTLLGQIDVASAADALVVVARREWVREHLPEWLEKWELAERDSIKSALAQRRNRLVEWKNVRPPAYGPADKISAWLDDQLGRAPEALAPSTLMIAKLNKADVQSVRRRGATAASALRSAWVLGLKDPESTKFAALEDAIAGRGMTLGGDQPVSIDRLLPPSAESEAHWLLRRAATEVLYDEGLRFVRFGSTLLPEPMPGQTPDPTAGVAIVEGTIKDVLGVGGADPLPNRLMFVASRGRVGAMVTRIEIAPDFSAANAESSFYSRGPGGWDRSAWRTGSLEVGNVPPLVVSLVASDPQVKAMMALVESLGGGLVSAEMKQRGLLVGATAGGAAVLARTALTRSLVGLALDLDEKPSPRAGQAKP
jgi:hypothetical protein